MKKIKLLFLLLILSCTFVTAYAQDTVKVKNYKHYYSFGTSLNNTKDLTYTIEYGLWGVKKPACFGASIDYTPTCNQIWYGVKAYLNVINHENYGFYMYSGPKLEHYSSDIMIDSGLGMYVESFKNIYIGYFAGYQSSPYLQFSINLIH